MRDLETLAAVTLALLLGASTALADPPADKPAPGDKAPGAAQKPGRPPMPMKAAPGPGSRDPHMDARMRPAERGQQMPEQMAERAEKRREARREFSEKFKAKQAERRASRLERRAERREKLKKDWGEFAERRPFMAEFRIHAWRMARLHRMQMLAEELDKPQLLERIKQLIEKEEARHGARLEALKADKPGAAPGAASGSPPPTPASAAAPGAKADTAAKEADK